MAHLRTRPRFSPSIQHIPRRFTYSQNYEEDLQKFSDSRVMKTIAIGSIPTRDLYNQREWSPQNFLVFTPTRVRKNAQRGSNMDDSLTHRDVVVQLRINRICNLNALFSTD
ncbi:hypothetical protein AVEN_223310-1 [Araneus ventricosus]|uniref:Uncharacterized protein n=1 Tax=Araneus ventricosus TaxID=182803 RepID=A0A4Y2GDN4_ARAVE|nr:hypothetical protein AVEN_223310-1 [Araneus ventricosus]